LSSHHLTVRHLGGAEPELPGDVDRDDHGIEKQLQGATTTSW